MPKVRICGLHNIFRCSTAILSEYSEFRNERYWDMDRCEVDKG